jgi:hypothetical protein
MAIVYYALGTIVVFVSINQLQWLMWHRRRGQTQWNWRVLFWYELYENWCYAAARAEVYKQHYIIEDIFNWHRCACGVYLAQDEFFEHLELQLTKIPE